MQLRVDDGKAVMRTRKGLDWTKEFSAVAEAATGLEDCILHGEVVALDHNGAPDFSALQAALSEKRSKDLTYFVFDVLHAGGEDLRRLPLTERKERLRSLLKRSSRAGKLIKFVEHLSEPGDAVLQSACRLNLEGIISKCATAPYQSRRTETWLKAKCRGSQEWWWEVGAAARATCDRSWLASTAAITWFTPDGSARASISATPVGC
jgi:bifunctional non-homologous end joining protein LigD